MRPNAIAILCLFAGCMLTACKKDSQPLTLPAHPPVTGKIIVVATLEALPGSFPADDLYNYAYVMKYRVDSVLQGSLKQREILVAHYKPRLTRAKAKGETENKTGGNLDLFREGDRHYLVLNPLDSSWQGALEDNYPQDNGPRWWASWADRI